MKSTGTHTIEGFVAHLKMHYGSHIIDAPVKLDFSTIRTSGELRGLCRPVKCRNGYVYALPGGKETTY